MWYQIPVEGFPSHFLSFGELMFDVILDAWSGVRKETNFTRVAITGIVCVRALPDSTCAVQMR
jgi:hypothetical protein